MSDLADEIALAWAKERASSAYDPVRFGQDVVRVKQAFLQEMGAAIRTEPAASTSQSVFRGIWLALRLPAVRILRLSEQPPQVFPADSQGSPK